MGERAAWRPGDRRLAQLLEMAAARAAIRWVKARAAMKRQNARSAQAAAAWTRMSIREAR